MARARIVEMAPEHPCLLCSRPSRHAPLCTACDTELPRLTAQVCPQCAEPTTFGERCGRCLSTPPHFCETRAALVYAFPVDRLIHGLKFAHQLNIAPWGAQQLVRLTAGMQPDCIIPMPLHPQRLHARGFNQALELARPLEKSLNCPVDRTMLIRTRATPPQAEQTLKARRSNVAQAFECRGDLSNAHVLLIDDVMTTGATASECARVLKIHGARQVTVAVLARALHR